MLFVARAGFGHDGDGQMDTLSFDFTPVATNLSPSTGTPSAIDAAGVAGCASIVRCTAAPAILRIGALMTRSLRLGLVPFLTLVFAMLATLEPVSAAGPKVTEFELDNGMRVVVVPDTRAPVVTHMVWYRVGAADEPQRVSGIAHFLEHLMFKSTEKIAIGEFSKIIARMGGQDNAFTSQDATAYFQRVAKEKLPDVMAMEADRMVNLRLTEKEVVTERDVVLEERRSRVENSPSSIFQEQMDAALYYSHPYGTPVIGWEHEIKKLNQEDALDFYKKFYAPNNAILVVAGDVTPEQVKTLATETYGQVPRNADVGQRGARPEEPPHRAARRLELRDARAGKPSLSRYYLAPSYLTAKPGEAEALDLLVKIVASGSTSRLYRKLVVEDKIASSAGGYYFGSGRDSGKIVLYAIASSEDDLPAVEAAIDEVIEDVRVNGVTDAELERAKNSYVAEYIYESDSQSTLARRYGWGLVVGQTIAEIDAWPDMIAKVTKADIMKAAENFDMLKSVTGTLLPDAPSPSAAKTAPANAATRG